MNILHLLGKRPARPVIDEALLSSLLTLAWVVEARDPYTGGHLWRVAQYCALLAEKSGSHQRRWRALPWVVSFTTWARSASRMPY